MSISLIYTIFCISLCASCCNTVTAFPQESPPAEQNVDTTSVTNTDVPITVDTTTYTEVADSTAIAVGETSSTENTQRPTTECVTVTIPTTESITVYAEPENATIQQSTPEEFTTASVLETTPQSVSAAVANVSTHVVGKLSDQIRIILRHFQNPSEVALPGDIIIPDPMSVPDMSGSLGVSDGNFTNITVHEQSKFVVDSVNTNLDEMQVYISLRMNRIVILGNYEMSTVFVGVSEGPFNVTLSDVIAEGTIYLSRDEEGRIFANRSVTNMVQQGIHAHFVNSSGVYQGLMNLAATFLFIGIKPYILNKIDEKLCKDINERLSALALRLPSSPWSPVDLAILEGRKYVRRMGYDPLIINDIFKYDQNYLTVRVDRLTIRGLSKFSRVGNVTLLMENNIMQFGVRVFTGRLEGSVDWFYDFGKIGMMRNGSSTFTVSRIQVHAVVNQSADIRNRPVLDSLDLETGPVAVKMDGEGSFDYVVEFVVMLLPKMIRHMIVDSLEIPIKYKIQEILDNINVEKLVDENIDDIDTVIQSFKLEY